jgi:hypothetical protein
MIANHSIESFFPSKIRQVSLRILRLSIKCPEHRELSGEIRKEVKERLKALSDSPMSEHTSSKMPTVC